MVAHGKYLIRTVIDFLLIYELKNVKPHQTLIINNPNIPLEISFLKLSFNSPL
jgi:hypothetical protein